MSNNRLWIEKIDAMIETSILLLKEKEPDEGFFFAFSGGKDSVATHDIVKRSGVKFTAYFNRTSVDQPEMIRFIKEHFPDTIHLRPNLTMFQLIVKKKILPTRIIKYCCENLKHYSGKGRFIITGIRAGESQTRAKRSMIETDKYSKGKQYIHPVLNWSELDVWTYIKHRNLPVCPLYDDENTTRIGCIGCPCQGYEGMKRDFARYPRVQKAYLWAIRQLMDKYGYWDDFGTAKNVLEWWMLGDSVDNYLMMKRIEAAYKNDSRVEMPEPDYSDTLFGGNLWEQSTSLQRS